MKKLTPAAIAKATDAELVDALTEQATIGGKVAERAIDKITAEIDRREALELEIAALVEGGALYRDAYAQVHNLDPAELERQERKAILVDARMPGETLENVVDRLYGEMTQQAYVRAENDCRGHLLNKAGQAAVGDPYTLFHGPAARVRKYASDELKSWFYKNGRVTWIEYKALMLGRASDVAMAAAVDHNYGDAVAS